MKQTLTYFVIIIFCSCGQKSKQTIKVQDSISVDSTHNLATPKTNEKLEVATTEGTILKWENQEDSLRNEILKTKENRVLKNSFLQEMYIRNVAQVSKDSLFLDIPFDIHGADCGAPDCYTTDVSFGFKFDDTLIFPEKVQFNEYEYGCVEKEIKLSGTFQLVELTNKHVIYYSTQHKRTLVLFKSFEENFTLAYYFTGLEKNRINGKSVYKVMENFDEDDKNSIYPYTSWILSTNEYENFLN